MEKKYRKEDSTARASYAIGVALAPFALSFPGMAFFILVAMGVRIVNAAALIWVARALLLCWSSLSAIGFIISTYLYTSSPYTLKKIVNILSIGLVLVRLVYYSAEILGSLSGISCLIPTSNLAALVRGDAGLPGLSMESGVIRWLILGVTMVVFTALTALQAKWRET